MLDFSMQNMPDTSPVIEKINKNQNYFSIWYH